MKHVFYHGADLDGWCAGFICSLGLRAEGVEYELHSYDYGNSFPHNEVDLKKDSLIFTDVVPSPYDNLLRICQEGYDITIIDHHKSLIEFVQSQLTSFDIKGLLSDQVSACMLAWKYYFPSLTVPEYIKLLSLYDTWNNKDKELWDNRIMPFQLGSRVHAKNPSIDNNFWNDLQDHRYDSERINKIINDGIVCMDYKKQDDEKNCHLSFNGTMVDFPSYRCICLNTGFCGSQTFESKWNENDYDIMLAYNYNGHGFSVSLYTTKDIDVSKIAVSYGGGGHKQAAGFRVKSVEIKDGIIIFTK
jgi:oligoribonuclease NrnB/cAMP/cGMP phosphodiesterase (DHH superfamily)